VTVDAVIAKGEPGAPTRAGTAITIAADRRPDEPPLSCPPVSAAAHPPDSYLRPSLRGRSEALRAFVAEMPWERGSIFAFVEAAAAATAPGAQVLDVGAGDAPYRELFAHADYRTSDWTASPHPGARSADVIGSAEALPLADAELDVVLCTQVLEHVPDPAGVLAELHRILRPGGRLYLSAPLVWELHELPHDYYRYTQPALEHLLGAAGFADVEVRPRTDSFTALAQLMTNVSWQLGRAGDGLDPRREEAAAMLRALAGQLAELAPLDAGCTLPLGYTATGTRAR
jgi:SAM-dependent methyltransferase